jgi:hypothetical protein
MPQRDRWLSRDRVAHLLADERDRAGEVEDEADRVEDGRRPGPVARGSRLGDLDERTQEVCGP